MRASELINLRSKDVILGTGAHIQKRLALVHGAARSEPLSARAVVDVAGRIMSKVAAREGTVISLRLVEHGDMWCEALDTQDYASHQSIERR
ncbi:hypothetical protein CQ13_11870 [Bradyrhizobium retamae]|uniref:Uncharacterized protein n=1 Tax=Bradyrhizobium retamae TaxID=1300035 RepID=A0A0R3MA15_9BRAD|nr:hypothetical protein CQ13_11870 [Bradyrhizobium retamae]